MPDIRYKSLTFRNGYAYRECEIPLDQQGLVLVRGLNLDDGGYVGAGKTSPFEVFSLLQTGRVGKQRPGERMLADDVVNLNADGNFEAKLSLDIDGSAYELIQYRQHRRHNNKYIVKKLDSVTPNEVPNQHRRKPQEWVARNLMRVDPISFFNYIYMAQNFSNAMLTGTDGDRQRSIIQMFGLDAYDALLKKTKERLSKLRSAFKDVDALRDELAGIEADLQQYTDSPETLQDELAADREKLVAVQAKHANDINLADDLGELCRDLKRRKACIDAVTRLWGQVALPVARPQDVDQVFVDRLCEEEEQQIRVASKLQSDIRSLDQREVLQARLDSLVGCDLVDAEKQLRETQQKLRELNGELPRAEQRLEVVLDLRRVAAPARSKEEIQAALDAAQDQRRAVEKRIADTAEILKTDVCPTCGRPFAEDTQHDATALRKQIQDAQEDLRDHAQHVHTLSAELADARYYEELRERLAQIGPSASPNDLQREIKRCTREERRLTDAIGAEKLRATLTEQLAALPTLPAENLQKELRQAQKQGTMLRDQVRVATAILEKAQEIRSLPQGRLADVEQQLRAAQKAIRDAAGVLVEIGERIGLLERLQEKAQRAKKIEQGIQETRELQEEMQCLQALEEAFGPKGLKRDRFMSILRDAAAQTVPYYTQLLWPRQSASISLHEADNTVKFGLDREGTSTSSRLLSGGERVKAGMALLFGLRDLKEKYTGLRLNLLIVDEPFGNLDSYSTDHLLRLLATLKNRFGSVIVIGNQRDVLDHSVWDQTWWAVRENNEAKMYLDGLPTRYKAAAERYAMRVSDVPL